MLNFYETYLLKNILKIPKTKTQQKDPAEVVRDSELSVRLGSTEKHNWGKDLLKHQNNQPKKQSGGNPIEREIISKYQQWHS